MRRTLFLCTALLLAALSATAQGSEAQGSEAQARLLIAKAAQDLNTMQCDFVQTKQIKMLNDKMVSQGHMYYSKGSKLRWEYVKPYQYVFVMNGDRVMVRRKDRTDVIDTGQNKLFREMARIMMSSMAGSCIDDDRTFATTLTAGGSEWVATLTPQRKNMRQLISAIVLHFDQRQATVKRLELVESNGDRTIIDLKNIRKNETLSPSLFALD